MGMTTTPKHCCPCLCCEVGCCVCAQRPPKPSDLADRLPRHIRRYVDSIRPQIFGNQRTVKFKSGGVGAIYERDIIEIAALLIEHPHQPPGPCPDGDPMLSTDTARNSGAVR